MKHLHKILASAFVLSLIFFALPARAATISLDEAVTGPGANGVSTLSWTHTATSTTSVIVVGITSRNTSNTLNLETDNGSAMTLVKSLDITGSAIWIYVYYFQATTTVNLMHITRTGSTGDFEAASVGYAGVATTGFPDASKTSTGSGTPFATSLTSVASNCWFVLFGENNTASTVAGTGSTFRATNTNNQDMAMFDSNGPQASGYSMSVAGSSSSVWGTIMLSMAPALPIPPGKSTFIVKSSMIVRSQIIIK